jgi:hypothetical protein
MSVRKSNDTKSSYKSGSVGINKPFCKVCQDAGKPESEYTSHFVRSMPDKNGKTTITCPVLATTECRYCHQLGHTTKFCDVIEERKKRIKKQESIANQVAKAELAQAARTVTKESRKSFGTFDVFADDSDDSDDEMPVLNNKMIHNVKSNPAAKVVDEFPALVEVTRCVKPSNASLKPVPAVSWAAVAEKPAPLVYKHTPPKVKQTHPNVVSKMTHTMTSWADWSDSDDDEITEDKFVSTEVDDDGW